MATYTSHYNLKKPATSDKIRIADFNGNADTIDATMYDNASLGAQLKADIGIVENTNTATHNISSGQYVIWKGSLYTASSAISSGATLSSANLTAVSGGGLNALNSKITSINNLYSDQVSAKSVVSNNSGIKLSYSTSSAFTMLFLTQSVGAIITKLGGGGMPASNILYGQFVATSFDDTETYLNVGSNARCMMLYTAFNPSEITISGY